MTIVNTELRSLFLFEYLYKYSGRHQSVLLYTVSQLSLSTSLTTLISFWLYSVICFSAFHFCLLDVYPLRHFVTYSLLCPFPSLDLLTFCFTSSSFYLLCSLYYYYFSSYQFKLFCRFPDA